ncbi:hypothetical protein FACS189426_12670 [Bacteroidia bacterium]|nr:hypothetical protein FACS189426_12670 [Bacteroidia bacterium]
MLRLHGMKVNSLTTGVLTDFMFKPLDTGNIFFAEYSGLKDCLDIVFDRLLIGVEQIRHLAS